ncbi:hypothetical protein F7725_008757 [Dissostichus mawsoni]|uniref:Uncharacterized protein n=1 Tax=Dissostichus mawsoni TaxID=36200 RepID=A0A7J5Y826_DISMA|nr:hypothetical protein F7725_008757 [Dissostichus mawsoni]
MLTPDEALNFLKRYCFIYFPSCTHLVCPMRCTLPMACSSWAGLRIGSTSRTWVASMMFRPLEPVVEVEHLAQLLLQLRLSERLVVQKLLLVLIHLRGTDTSALEQLHEGVSFLQQIVIEALQFGEGEDCLQAFLRLAGGPQSSAGGGQPVVHQTPLLVLDHLLEDRRLTLHPEGGEGDIIVKSRLDVRSFLIRETSSSSVEHRTARCTTSSHQGEFSFTWTQLLDALQNRLQRLQSVGNLRVVFSHIMLSQLLCLKEEGNIMIKAGPPSCSLTETPELIDPLSAPPLPLPPSPLLQRQELAPDGLRVAARLPQPQQRVQDVLNAAPVQMPSFRLQSETFLSCSKRRRVSSSERSVENLQPPVLHPERIHAQEQNQAVQDVVRSDDDVLLGEEARLQEAVPLHPLVVHTEGVLPQIAAQTLNQVLPVIKPRLPPHRHSNRESGEGRRGGSPTSCEELEGAGQPATFDPNHQAFVDQLHQSLLHVAAVPQEVAAVRRSDVREDGVNGDASTRLHLLYPGEEHHTHRCTKHKEACQKETLKETDACKKRQMHVERDVNRDRCM